MRVDKVELYRGGDGDWHWRFRRSNGKILADSAEGYKRRTQAQGQAEYVLGLEPGGEWERVNADLFVGHLT